MPRASDTTPSSCKEGQQASQGAEHRCAAHPHRDARAGASMADLRTSTRLPGFAELLTGSPPHSPARLHVARQLQQEGAAGRDAKAVQGQVVQPAPGHGAGFGCLKGLGGSDQPLSLFHFMHHVRTWTWSLLHPGGCTGLACLHPPCCTPTRLCLPPLVAPLLHNVCHVEAVVPEGEAPSFAVHGRDGDDCPRSEKTWGRGAPGRACLLSGMAGGRGALPRAEHSGQAAYTMAPSTQRPFCPLQRMPCHGAAHGCGQSPAYPRRSACRVWLISSGRPRHSGQASLCGQ